MNSLLNKIATAWERRRAYAALMQLDDRLLTDIGINRSSIMERLIHATRNADTGRADVSTLLRPATVGAAANEDSVIRRAA